VRAGLQTLSVTLARCAWCKPWHLCDLQAAHKAIRLKHGKEVFELQPDVHWNKGW
jgi:hypothetical protein